MSAQMMTPDVRAQHLESVLVRTLQFLRTEIYSTPDVLQELLGYRTKAGCVKALRRLEADGLLKVHKLQSLGARGLTLWGITSHGQVMAWPPDELPEKPRYFEPSKMSITTLQHTIDIQCLRIRAEHYDIEWHKPDVKPYEKRKVPDGIATFPNGQIVAIEVERTLKTPKRYREIIADYLQLIRGNKYNRVHYICPTQDMAVRLEKLFRKVESIPVGNRDIVLEERHYQSLTFFAIDQWPGSLELTSCSS